MQRYYDILGVSPEASKEEIKKQYKKRVFETHPDRNNGDDSEFKLVTEAYEALNNSPTPNTFDFNPFDHIHNFMNQMNEQTEWKRPRPPKSEEEINLETTISVADIKRGSINRVKYRISFDCKDCNGVGGSGKRTCPRCNGSGKVVHTNSQMGFVMQASVTCAHCQGAGSQFENVCKSCEGQGWTDEERILDVEIKEKGK